MSNFNWTCPFCNRNTTIVDSNYSSKEHVITTENKQGMCVAITEFIVCPNPDCLELSMAATLHKWEKRPVVGWIAGERINGWNLIPESNAKVYPNYIPKPIREDYKEACLIKNLSPKASATLSRRCMQGMIRNFWKVKGETLYHEIDAIKDKVESQTWEAIDGVREVGNIGAHMQKDINLVVDVEPKEAELLINLIEILMKDWYINQHERNEKLKQIVRLGKIKKSLKDKAKKKDI